ncbi:MAG: ribose 5-phosphate isomerase B [Candidatus Neomarinimicrobiota bacterium]
MAHEDRHDRIVIIGSDHAGYEAKSHVIDYVRHLGFEVLDLGTHSTASVDYPDYGVAVARALSGRNDASGIVICGTGIGISIAANKVKGARAALCTTPFHAEMARKHNNANILAMGARTTTIPEMEAIIDAWFANSFEGGRHLNRVNKIHSLTEISR